MNERMKLLILMCADKLENWLSLSDRTKEIQETHQDEMKDPNVM